MIPLMGQDFSEERLGIRIARVVILLSSIVLILLALAALFLLFIAFGSLSNTNLIENIWLLLQAGVGFYAGLYKSHPALFVFVLMCSLNAILVTSMVIIDSSFNTTAGVRHMEPREATLLDCAKQVKALIGDDYIDDGARSTGSADNGFSRLLECHWKDSRNPILDPPASSSGGSLKNRFSVEIPSQQALRLGLTFQWSIVAFDILLAIMGLVMALTKEDHPRNVRDEETSPINNMHNLSQIPPPQLAPPPSKKPSHSRSSNRKSPASPPNSRLSYYRPSSRMGAKRKVTRSTSPPFDSRRYKPQPVVLMNQMQHDNPLQPLNHRKSVESNPIPKAMTRTGSHPIDKSP